VIVSSANPKHPVKIKRLAKVNTFIVLNSCMNGPLHGTT
jgi:hypothetical protein